VSALHFFLLAALGEEEDPVAFSAALPSLVLRFPFFLARRGVVALACATSLVISSK